MTTVQGARTTRKRATKTTAQRRQTATPRRQTTAQRRQTTAQRQEPARARQGGAALPIPVLTPHVKVYNVRLPGPGMDRMAEAGRSAASHLPSRERLAFYGALGAMAAFEVISWPVAAAVGVGTAIAGRNRGTERSRTTES